MDQISQLKSRIEKCIQGENIIVYDVIWAQDGNMKILRVSIMHPDGSMNIDTCAEVSSKISDMLDEDDSIAFEYYLEVCSPGAERELRDEKEVQAALDAYVFIKFKNPSEGMDSIKGYLREIQEDSYLVEYQDKAVKKKRTVTKDNVELIRLSVKI